MRLILLRHNRQEAIGVAYYSYGSSDGYKIAQLDHTGKLNYTLLPPLYPNLVSIPPFASTITDSPDVHTCITSLTNSSFVSNSVLVNTIYWYPIFVSRQCTIRGLAVNVTSPSSNATENFIGFYSSDVNLNPFSLISFVRYTSNTTGYKTINANIILMEGINWIALLPRTAHSLSFVPSNNAVSFGIQANNLNNIVTHWRTTNITILPNLAPIPLTSATGNVPAIFVTSISFT